MFEFITGTNAREKNLSKNALDLIITGMMEQQQSTVNKQVGYHLFCESAIELEHVCFDSQDGSTIVRAYIIM